MPQSFMSFFCSVHVSLPIPYNAKLHTDALTICFFIYTVKNEVFRVHFFGGYSAATNFGISKHGAL